MLTLNLLRHHDADLAKAFPGEDLYSSSQVALDVSEAVDATVFEIYPNDETGVPVATVSRGSVIVGNPAAFRRLLDAAEVGLEGLDDEDPNRDDAIALLDALIANLDLDADETVEP